MRIAGAVLLLVGCLLGGAGTAVATVALHQMWWGLLLGAVASVAALLALRRGWRTRLPYAVGWSGTVGWLTLPEPGGGYAIGANTSGYAVSGLALLVLFVGMATLPRPGRRPVREAPPT